MRRTVAKNQDRRRRQLSPLLQTLMVAVGNLQRYVSPTGGRELLLMAHRRSGCRAADP